MITLHYLQCSRSFRILWALGRAWYGLSVEYYQDRPVRQPPESLNPNSSFRKSTNSG